MKKLGAIYARLSREDEDKIDGNKDSRSIENQIKVLSDYAKENGIEIVKVYYDDGYSGANQDRTDFQQMLKDVYAHKFNILLIKDISRLGRVLHQVGLLIEQTFPDNNIRVISLGDNYDSDNYVGESIVLRNFLNAYYLKDFRRKCRKSLQHRARTKHLNYYPKYGYYFDENRKEQIDPYSSAIVKQIFVYASEGKTTPQIARLLNEAGILTRSRYAVEVLGMKPLNKKSATEWNAEKVWEIVKDYEYCGHSLNLLRKDEPPILVRNTHFAIITEELFKKANEQISSRTVKRLEVNHLGGILKDELTGKNMTYCRGRNKSNEDFYYSKQSYFSIKAKTLHSFLYEECMSLINSCIKNSEAIKELYKKRIFKAKISDKQELEFKLASLNDEYSRLLQDFFDNRLNQIKFDKKSQELVDKIKAVEKELNEFNEYEAQVIIYERKFLKFMETIQHAPDDEVDLIKMVISKVLLSKPKAQKEIDMTIIYKFEEI